MILFDVIADLKEDKLTYLDDVTGLFGNRDEFIRGDVSKFLVLQPEQGFSRLYAMVLEVIDRLLIYFKGMFADASLDGLCDMIGA